MIDKIIKLYRTFQNHGLSIHNINYKHRFIFIHIPKTGGTSFRLAFNVQPFDHYTVAHFKKSFSYEYKHYQKVAFVREPISRFVSLYNYARMKKSFYHASEAGIDSISGKHPQYDLTADLNINDFVSYLCDESNTSEFVNSQWLPQTHWLFVDGNLALGTDDFLGKFENLQTDFDLFCKKINMKYELPKENITQYTVPSTLLTMESIDKLKNYYRSDYITFQY